MSTGTDLFSTSLVHTKGTFCSSAGNLYTNLGLPPYSNLSFLFQPSDRLDRPQDPRFQKPMETFQVQLRVQSSPLHRALINHPSPPPTKSAHIKRRQYLSLIHVGSPMVMVHWLLAVLTPYIASRFLGFTSHPSRHLTYVMDPPGDISVFKGSWAQNVNFF